MDPSTSHAGLAARLAVGWPGAQAPSGRSAAALMVPPSRAFPVRCRPLVAICGVASLLAHHPGPQRGGGVWAERRAAPRAGGSGRGLGVRRALPGGLQGDVWAPLGLKATGIGLNHSGGQVPRSQILGLEAGLQSSRDPQPPTLAVCRCCLSGWGQQHKSEAAPDTQEGAGGHQLSPRDPHSPASQASRARPDLSKGRSSDGCPPPRLPPHQPWESEGTTAHWGLHCQHPHLTGEKTGSKGPGSGVGPSFRTPRTSFLCYLGEEASQEEVSCLCGAAAGAGGIHPHTQVMRLQGRVPTWPMWGGLGRAGWRPG